MYIKLDDNNEVLKFPYNPKELKRENPNTSFPARVSDSLLESYNVVKVHVNKTPNYDHETQFLVDSAPYNEAGNWYIDKVVENFSEIEIQQRFDQLKDAIRGDRNAKLSNSDWMMVPDIPWSEWEKQAILDYRQALRDLTDQEGFPNSVVWPEYPV